MASSSVLSGIHSTHSPAAHRRVSAKFRGTAPKKRTTAALSFLSDRIGYSALSEETRSDLQRIQHPVSFPAGATVFMEGQHCRGVFILTKGRAKLTIANSDGKTLIVRLASCGEMLGLSACLTGGLYLLTLETTEPSEFAFVHCTDFRRFLDKHKDASYQAGQQLVRDCHGAYELVRAVGLSQNSTEKIARFLLHFAIDAGTHDGVCRIESHFTHDEIGQMVGANRETVTRVMSLLRKQQVIEFSGSNMLIRDMAALRQMVN